MKEHAVALSYLNYVGKFLKSWFFIILKVLHKGRLPYFLFGGNFPLDQVCYFLILKVFLNISAGHNFHDFWSKNS